ncbi:hypothetical protein ElyMa_004989300 [Elysia marginata]|uniref:Uncharacterized protein n=1 Tax=Elysia marginata TaxID=1093978 RepID=A0AAV4J7Q4_9GAST|nr:hypothetical protein ElyMa_004989300 [Elysia marginata]
MYAKSTGTPVSRIMSALKTCITATLTDRAAVNTCVTRQLSDESDSLLVLLKCNIHPLDSPARQGKQSLMKLEEKYDVKGNCYGSEGSAAHLIDDI